MLLASTSIMITISIRTAITITIILISSNMSYSLNQLQTSSVGYHDHHRKSDSVKRDPQSSKNDPLTFPRKGTFESSSLQFPPYYWTLQQLGKPYKSTHPAGFPNRQWHEENGEDKEPQAEFCGSSCFFGVFFYVEVSKSQNLRTKICPGFLGQGFKKKRKKVAKNRKKKTCRFNKKNAKTEVHHVCTGTRTKRSTSNWTKGVAPDLMQEATDSWNWWGDMENHGIA